MVCIQVDSEQAVWGMSIRVPQRPAALVAFRFAAEEKKKSRKKTEVIPIVLL